MEMLGPNLLRAYADALEDPRRMVNVEGCRRCSGLDQHLPLALNGAMSRRSNYKDFPNVGTVIESLKERLIKVSTPDEQSAILGLFYTNMNPLKRQPRVVVGVFPLYCHKVEYIIRPCGLNILRWGSYGEGALRQELAPEDDPLLVFNPKGPDFLYFKKSPFRSDHPYRTPLPKNKQVRYLLEPESYELALEENLIRRALWTITRGRRPELFRQTGFARFINSHRSDPKYAELYSAFTRSRR